MIINHRLRMLLIAAHDESLASRREEMLKIPEDSILAGLIGLLEMQPAHVRDLGDGEIFLILQYAKVGFAASVLSAFEQATAEKENA